jgi:hypothetical protein
MTSTIDPEVRRVLLEEIAFQRRERGRFRELADDETNTYGGQLKARMLAVGCNRAIRAVRDVWVQMVAIERRHAEQAVVPVPATLAGASELELAAAWGR